MTRYLPQSTLLQLVFSCLALLVVAAPLWAAPEISDGAQEPAKVDEKVVVVEQERSAELVEPTPEIPLFRLPWLTTEARDEGTSVSSDADGTEVNGYCPSCNPLPGCSCSGACGCTRYGGLPVGNICLTC